MSSHPTTTVSPAVLYVMLMLLALLGTAVFTVSQTTARLTGSQPMAEAR